MTPDIVEAWDALHEVDRFRPVYPSEPVVRFVARRFGGIGKPATKRYDLLDIGCGAGRHTILMATAGHKVTAIDPSAEGLRHAMRQVASLGVANVEFKEASMTALPFKTESFDGAVAYGVFLYGDAAIFATAVEEAYRVIRSGGRLLVVTRSTSDIRFTLGDRIEPNTVVLTDNLTNEEGMTMHFLDQETIDRLFSRFSGLIVDRIDHTAEGGEIHNSDWVIEAMK